MPPKKALVSAADGTGAAAATTITTSSVSAPSSSKGSAAAAAAAAAGGPGTMVKVNPNESDRLQLAQSINNLVLRGESFVSAMEHLTTFSKERLVELDLRIESKKQEFQDLTAQLSNHYKDVEIKLKQHLQEHKLDAVKEVLSGLNMTYLETSEHTRLVAELDALKATTAQQIEAAVEHEKSAGKTAMSHALRNMDLTQKAETASLVAQVEQQIKEIGVLKETISNLKHEIAEQRSLTKEVAIAGSKSNIQQSFGGK
jgi:hypothetical protein